MLVSTLALFLAAGAAGGTPEMVVFVPQPEGLDQKRAIEVWSVITAQLKEDRAKLGVSFKVQGDANTVLMGPGREQAWACGLNARCLSDIGATLGASVVVAGTLAESGVTLVVIDVAEKKKITGVKSSAKLATQASARQALGAAKGLVAAYLKVRAKSGKSVLAAEEGAEAAGEAALAEKTPKPAEKPAKPEKAEKAEKGGKGKGKTAKAEPPPPPPEPEVPPESTGSSIDGMIRIARSQLENVTEVSVDGVALVAKDDGSMQWVGSPGTHTVRAKRADGATYAKDIEVEPRSATDLIFEFTVPSAVASYVPTYEEEEKPVTKQWWFWTGVGGAVVAGSVLSLIFIGGSKGGPSISGEFGSVSGTY